MDEEPHNGGYFRSPSSKWNLLSTICFLCFGLLLSMTATTLLIIWKPLILFVFGNTFIITIITSFCISFTTIIFHNIVSDPDSKVLLKLIFYSINCALSGFLLMNAPLPVLIKSILFTSILSLVLFLLSLGIPYKFTSFIHQPLMTANVLMLLTSTYILLFGSWEDSAASLIEPFTIFGGLLVYSGLVVCNCHRLYKDIYLQPFDAVLWACILYSNIMNLYSRMIPLLLKGCLVEI